MNLPFTIAKAHSDLGSRLVTVWGDCEFAIMGQPEFAYYWLGGPCPFARFSYVPLKSGHKMVIL